MFLDDIFYTFHPSQDQVKPQSILDLNAQSDIQGVGTIIVNTPYQIIPELMYEDGYQSIILDSSYPYLTTNEDRYHVDTWWSLYAKCVYYLPNMVFQHKPLKFKHWMSCLAQYNEDFFLKHPTGIWALRVRDTLYVFFKINGSFYGAHRIKAASPDDSSYLILKLLEPYAPALEAMTLWTNDSDPMNHQILSRFIAQIKVETAPTLTLLHQIIQKSCAS